MTDWARSLRSAPVALAAGALVVALGTELFTSLSGGETPEFLLFVGRFHPLVVHLPIGVLLLVAAGEAATLVPRLRPRIDPALGLTLPFLLVATAVAFVFGHFLAREGGYAPGALAWHRRLELVAVIGVAACTAVWKFHADAENGERLRAAYRGLVGVTVAVLSVGAHFGGTLSRGDDYLFKYAPDALKPLLGVEKEPAMASRPPEPAGPEPLVYAHVVAPLLLEYCVACHGPDKTKGELRLDSLELVMKGGDGGPAVVAGSAAASELVRRMKLPADDDDRMPPEGEPAPPPEAIAAIAFWIDRGANETLRVKDTLSPAAARSLFEQAASAAPSAAPKVPGSSTAAAPGAPASDERPDGEPAAKPESDEPGATPTPSSASPSSPSDSGSKASDALVRGEPPESENKAVVEPAAQQGLGSARAVLAERCEKCHGPDKQKGRLRVDSLDALLRGGSEGPAVVPGNSRESELIRRVKLPLGAKGHMPPQKEPQLSAREVSLLESWVRSLGASSNQAAAKPAESDSGEARGIAASEADAPAPIAANSSSEAASATESSAEPGTAPAASEAPDEKAVDSAPSDAELLAGLPEQVSLYPGVVAPLLAERCGNCHGGEKPAANLRVDDHQKLLAGGWSGPGVVPGDPAESLVYQRISLPPGHDDKMPPEGEPAMSDDEIAVVRAWIVRGARADEQVPKRELDAPSVRVAASRGEGPAPVATLPPDSGGCAACRVGRSSLPHAGPAWLFALTVLALRRRAARHKPGHSRVEFTR